MRWDAVGWDGMNGHAMPCQSRKLSDDRYGKSILWEPAKFKGSQWKLYLTSFKVKKVMSDTNRTLKKCRYGWVRDYIWKELVEVFGFGFCIQASNLAHSAAAWVQQAITLTFHFSQSIVFSTGSIRTVHIL